MFIPSFIHSFHVDNLHPFADTSVDLEKYIRHKKESYSNLVGIAMTSQRENQEVRVFNDLDRDASGTLEWWEFAPSMCLRILSKRSQVQFHLSYSYMYFLFIIILNMNISSV